MTSDQRSREKKTQRRKQTKEAKNKRNAKRQTHTHERTQVHVCTVENKIGMRLSVIGDDRHHSRRMETICGERRART